MSSRPPLAPAPTRDIGRYRLAHRIAVGGMAEVYRALWPQAAGGDRAVVIKRLLPALVDDPEQRAMFDTEAELGMRVDHPNVVATIDHGTDEGTPYLVLEYVFGVDLWRLTRWMRRTSRPMRTPLAVWLGTELLAGLAAVHAVRDDQGNPLYVVHRDVSPSNVFLSVHGDVKLGDLGIARAALLEAQRRAGAPGFRAKGKLGYLPPEQIAGRGVDQRGDVFAAAVVLAELFLGRPLFAGGTEIGVLLAIRDGDVSPFRAIASKLPPGLGDAILRALDRRPERRTGSAKALRDALLPHVNEPIEHLRAELGALVVLAMDDEGESGDRTSLAATIEKDARFFDAVTPQDEPDPGEAVAYEVEREGAVLGRFSLAELVRALTTGTVRATDRARFGGGAACVIANVAELARHLPSSTRTPTARRRTQMAETSELYDLGSRSMLAVLIDVLLARDDGLLLCEHGELRKEIYLHGGVPTFVTSNQPGELLGEWLVQRGVLQRSELEMALALMPRFEGRLGETLVALGLVEPVQLFRHIGEQVREKLLDLFTWTRGHAALYRGIDQPERAFPLRLDPWDVLCTGAVRRIEAGLEDARFEGRAREVLELTGMDVERLRLPERLGSVWTACQVPRSLGELEGLGPTRTEARAAVLVLLELGAVHWRGRGGQA